MKKKCLLISAIMCFGFLLYPGSISNVSAATPATVKIGLFHGSNSQYQMDISADLGIGFNAFDAKAGNYVPVYSSNPGEIITIRKDSYFSVNGTKVTPDTASGSGQSGSRIGPYHIQIGNTYDSYDAAIGTVQGYKQNGIEAYPTYTDSGWQIWTGFFTDQNACQTALDGLKVKITADALNVVAPSDTQLYGVKKTGELAFMYASKANLLRGKSLSTNNPNPIKIGSSSYRGEVEFLRKKDNDMTVINVAPLEEYLYGVVPNEIESYSHIDALKAQAIAARTFTYISSSKHASKGFNLCNTTCCHVYKGYSSEVPASTRAVDDTRDMVVTYNGKLAETVYFSSSGGKTEAAVNVWGGEIPYLQSVEDKYESVKSYRHTWNITYTIDEISQKLKSYNLGTVTGIDITKYTPTGRPQEIIVRGTSKPEGVVFKNDRCRTFISLYSQWYNIATDADINIIKGDKTVSTQVSNLKIITANGEKTLTSPNQKINVISANGTSTALSASPTQYYFNGRGWGHSVGMSQEGAKGMANAGFTYQEILAHYYTGTKVEIKK